MTEEHFAYHALAIRAHGNYHALRKQRAAHACWKASAHAAGISADQQKKAYDALEATRTTLLLATDTGFPPLLHEIPYPPHALYICGATLTNMPHVAIVGTRKATSSGIVTAELFARDCARAGLTIVSGLAFGIDVAAHRATLAARGIAVAVLASGTDTITPRSNTQLGEEILASGGSIISEYPPGTKALPHFFLERNRIVSGLSLGVIVIEAPQRSGTLATARFAIEQNREVFVIPGSINDQHFVGSHALIRSGATLVTTPKDVLEGLGHDASQHENKTHTQHLPFLDSREQRIVELLSKVGCALTVDELAEQTMLGVNVINEALGILLIEGIIIEAEAGYRIR